jgi:hypothetical protein
VREPGETVGDDPGSPRAGDPQRPDTGPEGSTPPRRPTDEDDDDNDDGGLIADGEDADGSTEGGVLSVAEVAGTVLERLTSFFTGGDQRDGDAAAGQSQAGAGMAFGGAGTPVLWQTLATAPPNRLVLILGVLASPFLLWAAYRLDSRRERGW